MEHGLAIYIASAFGLLSAGLLWVLVRDELKWRRGSGGANKGSRSSRGRPNTGPTPSQNAGREKEALPAPAGPRPQGSGNGTSSGALPTAKAPNCSGTIAVPAPGSVPKPITYAPPAIPRPAPPVQVEGSITLPGRVQGLPAKRILYTPHARYSRLHVGQTYPVTEMPVAGSMSAGTLVGRPGPRGHSEVAFHWRLSTWFSGLLLRDHRLEFIGASRDYEPDHILHFEAHGLRIDIEIDEPYSGSTRKPMHWLGSYDDDRDVYFTKNGWVVIRFAEIQVVQHPQACIRHVAKVVDSLLGTTYGAGMTGPDLQPIPRWTYDQASYWAATNHREGYLGVEFVLRDEPPGAIEADLDIVLLPRTNLQAITTVGYRDTGVAALSPAELQIKGALEQLLVQGAHARFNYEGDRCLMKPLRLAQERARHFVVGHDLVWREERQYELRRISGLQAERQPYYRKGSRPGAGDLHEAVSLAIDNQLYLQLTYVNFQGERHDRTISRIEYNNDFMPMGYYEQHIKGYDTFRREDRTFRIDRIQEYAILNLSYA